MFDWWGYRRERGAPTQPVFSEPTFPNVYPLSEAETLRLTEPTVFMMEEETIPDGRAHLSFAEMAGQISDPGRRSAGLPDEVSTEQDHIAVLS